MNHFVVGVLMIVSLGIAWQDFRARSVHIGLLLLLLATVFPFHLFVAQLDSVSILFNIVFLVLLFLIAGIVSKYIFKKSMKESIGAGDVIYLFIAALYFQFASFIVWFNASIVFVLLIHLLVQFFSPASAVRRVKIPLAGYLGITFIIAITYETYVRSIGSIVPKP